MTDVHPVNAAGGPGLAEWLHLAATPTFAAMALLTGVGDGPMEMLCSPGHGSPLSGMSPMYWLMSVFHASPWLKLVSGRLLTGPGPCAPDAPSRAARDAS